MTYQAYISAIETAEKRCDVASKKMKEIQGDENGAMGLTPDGIKALPSFRRAKREFETYFKAIRLMNSVAPKDYLKRRRDERRAAKGQV